MEELRKVLKEADYSDMDPSKNISGGDDFGMSKKTKSPYFPGASGDDTTDLGTATITTRKPNPKIVKLQQNLKAAGLYNCGKKCQVDGILGPETIKAVELAGGTAFGRDKSLQDKSNFMLNIDNYIALSLDAAKKNIKRTADATVDPILAAAGAKKGSKDSVTPAGETTPPSSDDEFIQNRMKRQQDLEKKMNEPPTKIEIKEQLIAREIRKLLRKI